MQKLFELLQLRQLAQNAGTNNENKAVIDALIAKELAELKGDKATLTLIK